MRLSKSISLIVVVSLVAVLFAGAATLPATAQAVQPTTMQFRYDAQRTADYSAVAGSVQSNGKLLWSYPASTMSAPAIVNGVVYVGTTKNLYALNATTGTKLWSVTTGIGLFASSPAVANGVVYVGSDQDHLYALNATTGARLWEYSRRDCTFYFPVVANGIVYVTDSHGGLAGVVYALNATTGAELWRFDMGGASFSPAVANGVVYVENEFGTVYALNADTGAKLWSYNNHYWDYWSTVAVANNIVYIKDGGNVSALSASTGAKLWSSKALEDSSPAIANGVVYVYGADRWNATGYVSALNATTGAKVWTYAAHCVGAFPSSAPSYANGVVYVGIGGDMCALNATTGAKFWAYAASDDDYVSMSPPAIVNGVVYVGCSPGGVYAIGNASNAADTVPTALTLRAETMHILRSTFTTFRGTLTSGTATPVADATLTLQVSRDDAHWSNFTTVRTNSTGNYVLEGGFGARTYYVRAYYPGSTSLSEAFSPTVLVKT